MAAGDGLISMTPTSIAYSGTSASINADGGVDFSAVTSLSLNGVFTGDYDNYLVVCEVDSSVAAIIASNMRASGTDASAADYTHQYFAAGGSSIGAARFTSASNYRWMDVDTLANGCQVHFYGPYLAQPTAIRVVTVGSESDAYIYDTAATHSLSTSYDGFTIATTAGNFTGTVHVFGYEE